MDTRVCLCRPGHRLAAGLLEKVEQAVGALFDELPTQVLLRVKAGLLAISPAEYEVLREVLRGRQASEIAATLGCSKGVAEKHWNQVLKRCGSRRAELVRACHILDDDPQLAAYLKRLPPKSQGARFRRVAERPREIPDPSTLQRAVDDWVTAMPPTRRDRNRTGPLR
jgi:DNA-binding CsgD family transcriptional regulator